MSECDYCGEEFEDKQELHVHWGEEHEDEINSHEEEKVKKARRKREEEKEARMQDRKRKAGYALAGLLAVGFLAVVGPQLLQMMPSDGGEVDAQGLDSLKEGRPVVGDENASVTIVEFGDYLCPHCRDFESNTLQTLEEEDYFESRDVNYYHMHLPVVDQTRSTTAAVAAECVAEQDEEAYWNYHSALFDNQNKVNYNAEGLTSLAQETAEGLDYDQLQSCISSQETLNTVKADQSFARSQGFTGTPTVLINGHQVSSWSYGDMKDSLDAALERAE